MQHVSTRNGPTFDHVWIAMAVVLLVIGPLMAAVSPNDLWFHMATGRLIAATGAVPQIDSFSYTQANMPFYNQAWLAQVLLYGLYMAGGVPLLLIVHASMILVAYGLLLRLCLRRNGHLKLTIALFLAFLPQSMPDWNVRPQMFAFPLFVGFLYVLTAFRLGWFRRLWLLPPMMVLWVNIHGTFPLGIALIGATIAAIIIARVLRNRLHLDLPEAATPLQPLLIWGAVTVLALLINPRGWGVLGYVRNLVGNNAVTSLVTEWAPPSVREASGAVFFASLIVGGLILIYARRRPDITDVLMAVPLLWLALGAGRNISWFALVAVPLVIAHAAILLPKPADEQPATASPLNTMVIGVLVLMVVACLPWVKPLWLKGSNGGLLKNTPVAAVEWLKAQPQRPTHLFHSEAHGSYLTYAAPDQLVFIDPRIELYPYNQWTDYMSLSAGEHVPELIAKYQFDGMLLSREAQRRLISVMQANPAWQELYQDDLVVYFARR